MRFRPRGAAFALILAILAIPSPALAQLSVVAVPGMRLVYLDPTETFLVPHAARTFLNSLAFQRRLFDFHPKKPVILLLTDFSDSGNAAATVVPRDVVTVQIAPLSFAFETIAGNERMNTIMNHELVHVATMDQAAGRIGCSGAVRRQGDADRRAARVDPLLLPDVAARRGAALVSRGHRGVRATPGWPAASAARRAATTRWCSARWCATTRRSTIRSAWSRKARRSTSSSRSTRISTARAS